MTIKEELENQHLHSFDANLPKEWAEKARKLSSIEPVGNIVWGYGTANWTSVHGLPFAITTNGHMLLRQLANQI